MAETSQTPPQLCFNISYEVSIQLVGVFPSGDDTSLGYGDPIPGSVTLCLPDIDFPNNERRVSEELTVVFASIGIDSYLRQGLVSKVVGELRKHVNGALTEQREVLFDVQLLLKKVHYMVYDETEIVDINSSLEDADVISCKLNQPERVGMEPSSDLVLESYEEEEVEAEPSNGDFEDMDYEEEEVASVMMQSIVEYENEFYGMVPAAVGSMAMLKEVKVKEEDKGEICPVCLDELEEVASALPCEHSFHAKCIAGWLSVSHFCPLCRFEMPTEVSLS